jgi:MYXO-CTERM domain-containing protein
MLASRPLAAGLAAACAAAALLALAPPAYAQATLLSGYGGTLGYGTECLYPNDDGSSAVVDLVPAFPSGLLFFGAVQSSAYVNTNGNITFSGPVSTFTPAAFPIAAQPMIAPYWGDVDIRNTGGVCMGGAGVTCSPCTPCLNPSENGVWWYLEPGLMVVTWDRVGYYSCHNNLRMTFQLVLTAAGCGGAGDFDVEFRYNTCEWETGDASGGTGGFGGTEAQAGFDAGNLVDFVAIPGSMSPGIAATLCSSSNVGLTGVWQFEVRSGAVICPDAGMPCDTGNPGVCAGGRTNCVGMGGLECVQDVSPTSEQCDALDNDCNGMVDDGAPCPGTEVCAGGNCVTPCSEFFCGPGLVCDVSGLCIESSCAGVTCPAGERCDGGACVGACDGVICPFGQECRAGSCIDVCAGLTCDSCTVCEDGACVSRCEYTPCPAGETCQADGLCLEDACAGVVPCAAGFHCVGGACVDDCLGAVCPGGQTCVAGGCVPIPAGSDAGAGGSDAAVAPGDSGAGTSSDGGSGTGAPRPIYRPGCGCRTAGSQSAPPAGLLALALVALLVVALRRPRRTPPRPR